MSNAISGFSKLSKSEKIDWLLNNYFSNKEEARFASHTILELR
jgi:hydroxymethylglutaryl-CoA reductase